MRDNAARLMTLLRGGRVDRAPLWEPWFAMGEMLQNRYAGSYVAMANDLGHAAIPVGGLQTNVEFIYHDQRTAAGADYHGGSLREAAQLHAQPEPDYAAQVAPLRARQQECHAAGYATWLVIGWCFDRVAASMGLEHLALA